MCGGGGYAARLFLLFSFPSSADHERDWPPCKVVFFGLATNTLNARNNNNIARRARRESDVFPMSTVGHRKIPEENSRRLDGRKILEEETETKNRKSAYFPPQLTTQWHARGLHVTQPYSIVSSTSALSIRILSSRGALGRSYSSRVYFRKLHNALRTRRSTSMDRSAFWLTFPPRYTNSFVWLYT